MNLRMNAFNVHKVNIRSLKMAHIVILAQKMPFVKMVLILLLILVIGDRIIFPV